MSEIMGQDNTGLKRFDTNTVAFLELEKNGVDATNFPSEFYGILFPKGRDLPAQIDPAIQTVIDSGTYTEIYQKWFGEAPNLEALKP